MGRRRPAHPLPEPNKPQYLTELIDDAIAKGAKVVNGLGGLQNGPFVRPSVVYPVSKEMRVWQEEQFGPLIPIAPFSTFEQCYEYLAESPFGQQAALFTKNVDKCTPLLDTLAYSVGRVNINAQCQRGPDTLLLRSEVVGARNPLGVRGTPDCLGRDGRSCQGRQERQSHDARPRRRGCQLRHEHALSAACCRASQRDKRDRAPLLSSQIGWEEAACAYDG